jgi:hypothetical protein
MPWRKAIEQFYASYREARFQDVQTIFTRFFLQLTHSAGVRIQTN